MEKWHSAHGGLTGAMHRFWDWLNRGTPADEPMLLHLRKASDIEVLYPPVLTVREARSHWEGYLDERQRKHRNRFALNLAVSPLTVLLAPLPGPNVIGYWFVYRAVHHWLILHGLWLVRSGRVPVSFRPDEQATGVLEGLAGQGKQGSAPVDRATDVA
jgi:hypothetical protein